jgi:hypothetical protein
LYVKGNSLYAYWNFSLNAENDTANAELALLQARVALLMDRLRLSALAGQLDEAALQVVNATLLTTGNP